MSSLKTWAIFFVSSAFLFGGVGVTTVAAKPAKAKIKKAIAKRAHGKAVKRFKTAKKVRSEVAKKAAKKSKRNAAGKFSLAKAGGHLLIAKKMAKAGKFRKSVAHSRRAHRLATEFIKANALRGTTTVNFAEMKKENDLSDKDCEGVAEAKDEGVGDAEPRAGDLEFE